MAAVPTGARRSADWLVVIVLGQVALGFTQYFLGIPAFLVGLHIAGASLVWIFALRLQLLLALPVRAPAEPDAGTPLVDDGTEARSPGVSLPA